MAILTTDIKLKLSVKTGSAGNSQGSTPAGSLGKYISTTEITDASLHNLFDKITGDENALSEPEYRCIFVHNAHATLTLESAVVWLAAEVAGGATAAISVDATGLTPIDQAGAQAKEIATENDAPAFQTFTAPTTKGAGLSLGSIPAGQCVAVWVRRTAANTAPVDLDGVTLRVEGDTAA